MSGPRCDRPPAGWVCTRPANHDGPCPAVPVGESRRVVVVPTYTIGLAIVTVVVMCLVTLFAGVKISNSNAERLVARYERDKAVTAEQNREVYCTLFRTQMDAFDGASSPVGRASYQAWLGVYRLVGCKPAR